MSITPNLCCDETKNRGTYTHVTEGLMLKLKLQYFGHLMWRADSLEKGEGDDREWDGWMASPTQWTWVWVNSGSWWWTGRPGLLKFMAAITICSDFGAHKYKVTLFHHFPVYLPWMMGPDAMILVFWMLSFKPTCSLSFVLSSRGFWGPLHFLP